MKSTTDLLQELKNSGSIDNYLSKNEENIISADVSKILASLIKEKGLKKSEIIKKAELNSTYAYEIFRGEKTAPVRDKLLSILIAMELDFDEIQAVLKAAHYPILYAKNKRDSIIIMCIEKKLSVMDTNCELYRLSEDTL